MRIVPKEPLVLNIDQANNWADYDGGDTICEHATRDERDEWLSKTLGVMNYSQPPNMAHAQLHDPARVLAECEAKRRIVELHHPSDEFDRQACVLCQWDVDCEAPRHEHQYEAGKRDEWPCETALALASVYADHPDYREEWRL